MKKNLIFGSCSMLFFEVETPRIPYKYGEFLSSDHIIPNDNRELQQITSGI